MSSQLGAEISETILLRPKRRSAPATIDTLLMLVVYVSTAPDLSSFVVGVNKVGDVAHNESFTGFKSKEHCRVTARVDACYQHHLHSRRRRRRRNHINTISSLEKWGKKNCVWPAAAAHIFVIMIPLTFWSIYSMIFLLMFLVLAFPNHNFDQHSSLLQGLLDRK
jgi:hypothetical protein